MNVNAPITLMTGLRPKTVGWNLETTGIDAIFKTLRDGRKFTMTKFVKKYAKKLMREESAYANDVDGCVDDFMYLNLTEHLLDDLHAFSHWVF